MKNTLFSLMRDFAKVAFFVMAIVFALAIGMLGVLTIFGAFFFDSRPDGWMIFQHLMIFFGGVLALSTAVMIIKFVINKAFS